MNTELVLRAYFKLRRAINRRGTHILLAAMPKSASTFMHHALTLVTRFDSAYFASAFGNLEQELHRPAMIDAYAHSTVTQQHLRGNQVNIALLREFRIDPIIVTRNIFDVLVSMRDHLVHERANARPGRMGELPSMYIPNGFMNLRREAQLDYLVRYAAPWLMSFVASWQQARATNALRMLWLRYEDVTTGWHAAVAEILEFHGLAIAPARIETALDQLSHAEPAEVRLNIGVSGRGQSELTAAQRAYVVAMARCYDDIDFSPIGIVVPNRHVPPHSGGAVSSLQSGTRSIRADP